MERSANHTATTLSTPRSRPVPAAQGSLSSRERFLKACVREPVDFTPAWVMRQAGRALPEYRALKERYSFLELVRTPELATEVTLQPIRRFAFDAAILFSDILVIPEAMGQGYRFRDTGGIEMDFRIQTAADIDRLTVNHIEERLSYVSEAIRLIKPALNNRTALIGFAGSPWTLANFMLEGGSAKSPSAALALLTREPGVYQRLAEKLTSAVIRFLQTQITAGVEAIQIFDSHGGLLPPRLFRTGSGVWIEQIVRALNKEVPVIVFSKGSRAWNDLANCGADVLGIDHGIRMADALGSLPPSLAVQGNLDPGLLVGEPELVRGETQRLMREMQERPGWIFNLGHGLPPAANLDCIYTLLETLRSR